MIRAALLLLLCVVLLSSQATAGNVHQPASNGGCSISGTLPLDAGVAGISRAYGVCALTKAWLNRKFADVVANGVAQTIYFINGAPDTRKLARLMGNINPQYGFGGLPLAKWYDQTGSGDDCAQTTAANRMSVWLVNGKVSIAADGYFYKYITGGTTQDRNCLSSTVSVNSQASTFFFAGRPFQFGSPTYNSGGAGVLAQPGAGCCGGGAGAGFQIGGSGSNDTTTWNPSNFFTFSWDGFTGTANPQSWPETQPVVLGTIYGSTTVSFTQNEETPTTCSATCSLPAETSTGISIGADSGNGGQAGQGSYVGFQAYLIFGATALSSGNQSAIRNSLYQTFGIPSTQSYSVINDGASYDISQGGLVGNVNGYGWAEQMRAAIPYPVRFVNIATSGAKIADLTTSWTNMTALPCTGSFTKTILIGPSSAAGNSIGPGGETGAQAFTDLQAYLTVVKAKCTWSAIIVATLPGGGENANYSALVRSNAVSLGITVADWANAPVIGPNSSTNVVLYNQTSPYGGHPTVSGYSWIATPTLAALRTAIGK